MTHFLDVRLWQEALEPTASAESVGSSGALSHYVTINEDFVFPVLLLLTITSIVTAIS